MRWGGYGGDFGGGRHCERRNRSMAMGRVDYEDGRLEGSE